MSTVLVVYTICAWRCWRCMWYIFMIYRHADVIKWSHFRVTGTFVWGIHRSVVNFPHKGQWRGALMFSLIYAWTNGWVNHREAGDLRHHLAYFNVTVMDATAEVHWNQLKMSVAKICLKNYSCKNIVTWVLSKNIFQLIEANTCMRQ